MSIVKRTSCFLMLLVFVALGCAHSPKSSIPQAERPREIRRTFHAPLDEVWGYTLEYIETFEGDADIDAYIITTDKASGVIVYAIGAPNEFAIYMNVYLKYLPSTGTTAVYLSPWAVYGLSFREFDSLLFEHLEKKLGLGTAIAEEVDRGSEKGPVNILALEAFGEVMTEIFEELERGVEWGRSRSFPHTTFDKVWDNAIMVSMQQGTIVLILKDADVGIGAIVLFTPELPLAVHVVQEETVNVYLHSMNLNTIKPAIQRTARLPIQRKEQIIDNLFERLSTQIYSGEKWKYLYRTGLSD